MSYIFYVFVFFCLTFFDDLSGKMENFCVCACFNSMQMSTDRPLFRLFDDIASIDSNLYFIISCIA